MKKKLGWICYGILLMCFTTYVLLDTFVLQTVYDVEVSQTSQIETNEKVQTNLTTYEAYDTKIYVVDVYFDNVMSIQSAFAQNTYGKNVTAYTSTMAQENNAKVAINGDYYGAQESGYVIRNGTLYRETGNEKDVLCIYQDGNMEIISNQEKSAQELIDEGAWQAFSFGPGLIEEGNITVSERDEVGKAKTSNPRTAIGMIDTNHYVFVVSDGRTEESAGLSLYQLATFMKELDVSCAYNLDGGGSSTMVMDGQVINNPTTNGSIKERKVSDIIYVQ